MLTPNICVVSGRDANPNICVLFQGVMLTLISVLFQGVMQVERRLGGRLLDHPKQIPFQDGGHNLCLTIEDLNAGWRSKLAANYQVHRTDLAGFTKIEMNCSAFSLLKVLQ